MPRLFFAIVTPEKIRNGLRELQSEFELRFARHGLRARFENIDNSHSTLLFLGEVPSEKIDPLIANVRRRLLESERTQFAFAARGLGAFSKWSKARTLWCGLEPNQPFEELHQMLVQASRETQLSLQHHDRYSPHLTIARMKFEVDLRPSLGDVESWREWMLGDCVASEVVLIESNMSREGAVHLIVERFGLS